ncbi:hypothetical protein SCP_0805760 [Sparassis crispa]|uniref:Fe2OG dioxygenase domain-containing protein n=1 Tax=Sparassis crispa TaxID=139825 RepID=A0A401GV24_9APHY|nr:hypothetical protein SCP_0805760 [Sparassis crispa]GBE86052.1 hypothetical protein SCP_0805760 [Sparassis crispa]
MQPKAPSGHADLTRSRKWDEDTILGPGDKIGEGDTFLVEDILPSDLANVAFDNLIKEVQWNTMYHRGGEVPRLVAVEGAVAPDGSEPIYRHPADESPPLLPFSPTVARIRDRVEEVLKEPVNHVLIQHYRDGMDYISEHSDKTIDVVHGSHIVNVSIGAERVMTLRTKKDARDAHAHEAANGRYARAVQRVPLPHNSMLIMGLATNQKWLHSIRADKRIPTLKSAPETAFDGARVSLTFRHIGTFLTPDGNHIYGQGAKAKTREEAREVIRGGEEAEKLIEAFGKENHSTEFDWEGTYGEGSDVLHFEVKDRSEHGTAKSA